MKRLLPLLALVALLLSPQTRAEPTAAGLYARFETTLGTFWCQLEYQKAPRTVANFVQLAEGTRDFVDFATSTLARRPYYDGIRFHRVIPGFMIQGGSPNGRGTDGPGYQFRDEFDPTLQHTAAGTLSMANSGLNSNGSQFFVTVTNTPWLDGVHSVFGRVVEGIDVVHTLSKVPRNTSDVPLTPVVMNAVRIVRIGPDATAWDPATITPSLPTVGQVPTALRITPAKTEILLQSRTNRLQHAFFGSTLGTWNTQTFRGAVTNLDATSLRGPAQMFFRTLDGGYEP
jgi:cyclophilin family peptidyl-prolyl cis-trans isomerase